jgi:Biopolymer transport protein ExbD/TolR
MKKSSIKSHKARELDLLPVMSLFSILVTIVMSMATFEKLGILELWLPERGPVVANDNPPPDPLLLNLTVIITNKGITIGAAGGFQPTTYYQEEVEYRSKSDQKLFRKVWVPGEQVKSPSDGKVMSPQERETIMLNVLSKKDTLDPGTYVYGVVNAEGDYLLDTAGNWMTQIPPVGSYFRVVGVETPLRLDPGTANLLKVEKLSAYQEVARTLEQIHKLYSMRDPLPEDVDDVVILADGEIIYDKVIQLMDAAKAAGFDRVSLSLVGGEA